MIEDKINTNFHYTAEDRWLKIAFPVAIFSIFCSIAMPNIIYLIFQYSDAELNSFSKILIGSIPVQLSLILPLIITALLLSENNKLLSIKQKFKFQNWSNKFFTEAFKIELIIFFPLCLVTYLAHFILVKLGYSPTSPVVKLLSSANLNGVLLIFFIAVFIAPVSEEIIFRRIIFSFSEKLVNKNTANVITSFLFASLHGSAVQILPLWLLGCIIQSRYIKHNSLYPCIILHAVHNTVMMSLFFIIWSNL